MPETARRGFLAGAVLTGLAAVTVSGCSEQQHAVVHGEHGVTEDNTGISPAEALAKIEQGNVRFVEMTEIEPNVSSSRLIALTRGQRPFVGVLGCVDSRVPPELVFDRGLGDVFDARVAGAIPADSAVGSLEFGVEEFGVPLLVVLGHTDCGAVKAAVQAVQSGDTSAPGKIGAVLDPILPAVREVQSRGIGGDALVPAVVEEVVRRGVAVLEASPVLRDRRTAGTLMIVGAVYDLETGRVRFDRQ
jgi:carbonic anhydrase